MYQCTHNRDIKKKNEKKKKGEHVLGEVPQSMVQLIKCSPHLKLSELCEINESCAMCANESNQITCQK